MKKTPISYLINYRKIKRRSANGYAEIGGLSMSKTKSLNDNFKLKPGGTCLEE